MSGSGWGELVIMVISAWVLLVLVFDRLDQAIRRDDSPPVIFKRRDM